MLTKRNKGSYRWTIIVPTTLILIALATSGCTKAEPTLSSETDDTTTNSSNTNNSDKKVQAEKQLDTADSHVTLLTEIKELAQKGKAKGAEDFVVGTTRIDEVIKAWGEPDQSASSEHLYVTYSSGKNKGFFDFFVGQDDVVNEIRISDSSLDPQGDGNYLTWQDIFDVYGGTDQDISEDEDLHALVYPMGNYELKVTVPKYNEKPKIIITSISVTLPKAE
ncbi:DUF4309 domain-containing protein [Paenibacillus segetis]|uniref:DUF4309 domain-containing protein n=1 Tax=Paenibacillus segetis TaxID=1325360 RepID=A0ABQ1Y5A3_9BACL|nr:DUF4309 domain-containing protein [Paenibacillus segetis]GGH11818.1 hypothetical protein GCM10008013_03850 [Paenibacillus segetis]